MPLTAGLTGGKMCVALLPVRKQIPDHEAHSHHLLAEKIAALLGLPMAGIYKAGAAPPGSVYFIPSDTLVGQTDKQHLLISTVDDFFGGWVPEFFMGTKAITHPLFTSDCPSPCGWSHQFSMMAGSAVLRGYTAFSIRDAHHAGQQLLQHGPLRIKPVCACAGRGQIRIENKMQLSQALAIIDEDELSLRGLTLEEDLQQVVTYSVGQAEVAGLLISYVGTQQLTRNHSNEQVYGGSRLTVVRGSYEELLCITSSEKIRLAISQARVYEAAAYHCFPGLVASRRNYDVAQGFNHAGEFRSGVLEQSWRIGGASGAEILALEAFADNPSLALVHSATREIYGIHTPPPQACVLYCGDDADVGPITKYVELIHDNTYRTDCH